MTEINRILRQKTQLLCKGLFLDEDLRDYYKSQGIELNFGRKGGAGPLGGRYFLIGDEHTLANIALWDNPAKTSLVLKEKKEDNKFEVYNTKEKALFGELILVENPKYYSPEYKTSDGIEMKRIALVHGVDCLATTIYQKCHYWACGEACKFCGIELSLKYGTTILEKSAEQLNEVIKVAKEEGRCSHVTLTSGTTAEENKGTMRYINLIKGVRAEYPNLPLHIQIEPLEDLNFLERLKEAGADTIGIHIEVIDQLMRNVITPGKAKIPYEVFEKNWKYALEVFGENQVESFLLTGFGESRYDFLEDAEKMISLGVIPFITPVRPIPGRKSDMPIMNHNALLEIYIKSAEMMVQYGVNPLKNKAGCVRCGGCSAINEAYRSVK
ncbi:MAG: radical SAM protein [Candidatus Lokiarchaeota archaeon]|nr:radical SAM protein [Candidatus Lokiarchaeota archaeon]MBD3342831.1 radical SAM protein [Candidatus Lokiarchaeota archaeon]